MALVYSITGLQTQLQVVATAIDNVDFPLAKSELAKAHLIMVGLPEQAKGSDSMVKLRTDIDKLSATIKEAANAYEATDRRRLITTRVSHGRKKRS